jgi:hypothetical protein
MRAINVDNRKTLANSQNQKKKSVYLVDFPSTNELFCSDGTNIETKNNPSILIKKIEVATTILLVNHEEVNLYS